MIFLWMMSGGRAIRCERCFGDVEMSESDLGKETKHLRRSSGILTVPFVLRRRNAGGGVATVPADRFKRCERLSLLLFQ